MLPMSPSVDWLIVLNAPTRRHGRGDHSQCLASYSPSSPATPLFSIFIIAFDTLGPCPIRFGESNETGRCEIILAKPRATRRIVRLATRDASEQACKNHRPIDRVASHRPPPFPALP